MSMHQRPATPRDWPVQYPVEFQQFATSHNGRAMGFDVVTKPGREVPSAVLRSIECRDEPTLRVARDTMRDLEVHGVKTAAYLPFIFKDGAAVMVEYLEGPVLKSESETLSLTEVQRQNVFDLAQNLGRYYYDACMDGRSYAIDVAWAQQYALVNDEPWLIDIQFLLASNYSIGVFKPEALARELADIAVDYADFFNREQQAELNLSLEGLMRAYAPDTSLLTANPFPTIDVARWTDIY